jgi:hypothetical protein
VRWWPAGVGDATPGQCGSDSEGGPQSIRSEAGQEGAGEEKQTARGGACKDASIKGHVWPAQSSKLGRSG